MTACGAKASSVKQQRRVGSATRFSPSSHSSAFGAAPWTWIIVEPLRKDDAERGCGYSESSARKPLGVTSKAKWKAGRSSPGWSCA